MNRLFGFSLVLLLPLVSACGPSEDRGDTAGERGEHFLKEQTDAMQKAKDVEKVLQQGVDRQRKELTRQGG